MGAAPAEWRGSGVTDEVRDLIRNIFGPLDGAKIYGGCEHCEAYQTVKPITDGGWSITVHHDDWCPWWAPRQNRAARRKKR